MLHAAEISQAHDRDAIIAAIEEETKAYLAKDFERWADCWLRSGRTVSVTSGAEGMLIYQGWDAVANAFRQEMTEQPDPLLNVTSEKLDYQVMQDGDLAWVTFMTLCSLAGPVHFGEPNIFETRVLERFKGRWLISYMSVLSRQSGTADFARVQVDGKGRIIWAAPETIATLKDHPHLTVSHGILRSRRSDWDKILQKAIRESAAVFPYEHFNTLPGTGTRPHMIPVILGEDESGGVQSCTVYPRDGATYVTFDDGQRVARSVELAKMVFSLSEGQTRLCVAIASGQSLTDAAKALGITLNTARTHLSRVYDKTGVNSQTALVRVLLSVGIAAG